MFAILRFHAIIIVMERAANYRKIEIDTRHVDVLDGIRALSIGLIFWFHLWQQSWLMPYWHTPQWLISLGLPSVVSFDFLPRSGFLFVDMMLLISAFCLFLPHARALFCGEPVPAAKQFYKKRLVRIVPPYYLSVLLIFSLVALPSGAYASGREMRVDLLSTLTFTQTFVPGVLLSTKLNGVLWTAAIEMQFYLLFPLLASCFRKQPAITYVGMVAVSMAYLHLFALGDPDKLRVTLNQLPGFFGVFANGMLAAYGFVWLSTRTGRKKWIAALSTAVALFCLYWISCMQKVAPAVSPVQIWQASNRYTLSLAFALLVFSSALAARWFRFLLSNRVMAFFAAISYNVYIWHQWLAVQLKQWRIPYWAGEQAPNFTGDKAWQWTYTLVVIGATLLTATLLTHLFERPVARRLLALRRPALFDKRTVQEASAAMEERNSGMHHEFIPEGVCSKKITFDLTDDGKLSNVAFIGGCDGNLKTIGKLVEGKDAEQIAAMLKGTSCDGGDTSCADQFARAIEEAASQK